MWFRSPVYRRGNRSPVIMMPEKNRKALAKFLGLETVPEREDLVIPAGLLATADTKSFLEFWFDSLYHGEDYRDSSKRLERYNYYDMMEAFSGEVSLMLDTYADEALGIGFNRDVIEISTNKKEVTSYVLEVFERNDLYRNLRSYVRTMCKYGDVLLYVIPPLEFITSRIIYSDFSGTDFLSSSMRDVLSSSIEKVRKGDDKIFPYIVAIKPSHWNIRKSFLGKPLVYDIDEIDNMRVNITETPLRVVQMSLPDDRTVPYGMSIIEPMRVVADQLSTLEALMALSRASRIERIIVRVPTSDSNPASALYELSRLRAMWRNVIFGESSSSGNVGSGRPFSKTLSLTDMMFIPSVEGFSIETIKPSIDISTTEDVDYFVQKLLSLTGLPKGYFLADSTTSRGSALQAQDLKFLRKLLPIQNSVINAIVKLVYVVAAYGNFDISDLKVEASLSVPMEISEELINRYTTIFSSAKSIISDYVGDTEEVDKKMLNQILKYLGAPDDLVEILYKGSKSKYTSASTGSDEFGPNFDSDSGFGGIDLGDGARDLENDETSLEPRSDNSGEDLEKKQSFVKKKKSEIELKRGNSRKSNNEKEQEEIDAATIEALERKRFKISTSSETLVEVQIIRDLFKNGPKQFLRD